MNGLEWEYECWPLPLQFKETGIKISELEVEEGVGEEDKKRKEYSWEELRVLEMIGSHVIMALSGIRDVGN